MKNAAGIVNTHAHTIWPATPHRTADSRRVAPTPTIAPVIACGADRDADLRRDQNRKGRARFRREAADRLQFCDLRAHRVNDAPAAGDDAHRLLCVYQPVTRRHIMGVPAWR